MKKNRNPIFFVTTIRRVSTFDTYKKPTSDMCSLIHVANLLSLDLFGKNMCSCDKYLNKISGYTRP